jgi:P27 family predicted phage terminase small subunit
MTHLQIPRELHPDKELYWRLIVELVNDTDPDSKLVKADFFIVDLLADYMLIYSRIRRELSNDALSFETTRHSGNSVPSVKANPLLTQMDKVTTQIQKLLIQLGMTPKARKALGIGLEDEEEEEESEI